MVRPPMRFVLVFNVADELLLDRCSADGLTDAAKGDLYDAVSRWGGYNITLAQVRDDWVTEPTN